MNDRGFKEGPSKVNELREELRLVRNILRLGAKMTGLLSVKCKEGLRVFPSQSSPTDGPTNDAFRFQNSQT